MADASVTLKFSPSEFDLNRRALELYEQNMTAQLKLREITPAERDHARKEAYAAGQLLSKLNA